MSETHARRLAAVQLPTAPFRGELFCLHPSVVPCPAGVLCHDCGVVVGPECRAPPAIAALSSETGSRRAPVTNGIVLTVEAAVPPDACLQEWFGHVRGLREQPKEVVDAALEVFRLAYSRRPVTGPRARALALVSLLWASRRLHGNNPSSERVLLARLHTSTRLMNRAFSVLAGVIQPGRSCGDSPSAHWGPAEGAVALPSPAP